VPDRPRRRLAPLVAAVAAVLALAVAASLLLGRHHGAPPGPSPSAPITTLAPPDLAADRPTGVAVTVDAGSAVTLHWTLAPGTRDANLYLLVRPGTGVQILNPGVESYTVTGLDPDLGYCFEVGPIVVLGLTGGAGAAALSDPVCIRGAVPASTR
jgi:hypothetical protein